MEKQTEKSAWNLSESIIFEIANHFQNASRLYISEKYAKAFMELKTITHRVSAYFSDEERKEFRRLEDDMQISIQKSRRVGFNQLSIEDKIHKAWLRKKYDRYNDYLMLVIKKYGLYFSEKRDRTLLKS